MIGIWLYASAGAGARRDYRLDRGWREGDNLGRRRRNLGGSQREEPNLAHGVLGQAPLLVWLDPLVRRPGFADIHRLRWARSCVLWGVAYDRRVLLLHE